MKYAVIKIEEDLDIGCEERGDDSPVMAVVTLQDERQQTLVLRVPDQSLYDADINEGDTVVMGEQGELIKQEKTM